MKIEVIESLIEKEVQANSHQITALRVSQGRIIEELRSSCLAGYSQEATTL